MITTGGLAAVLVGRLAAQTPADLVRQKYEVDSQHSSVAFIAKLLRVVKVRGRFRDYSATIVYDPTHVERSSVTAVIVARSIDTDMPFRDDHLRSPDFLDTQRDSFILFQSDSILSQGDGLTAVGPLTLHGITRRIAFPIRMVLAPDTTPATGIISLAFETTLRLRRQDFDVAGSNRFNPDYNPATNLLGDTVDVILELFAQQEGYRGRHFHARRPPSIGDTLLRTIEARGIDEGVRLYELLRASQPQAYDFSPGQLVLAGHLLIERGRTGDAVRILELNTRVYPGDGGTFDALGEAECLAGDRQAAVRAFHRAAEIDPTDTTARELLRRLQTMH